ncbi:MAG: hypothetical protein H0W33_01200 [Gammaproteobacteria bacterium]|nr:hypothetical protein [Gammaproteobacteria bacterium]
MKKAASTLAFLLASPAAMAGVVFQMETAVSGQEPQSLEIAIADNNLAISGHADGAMIYRGEEQAMLAISHADDAYTVIDKKGVETVAATINPLLEQLERMPPKHRAQIEKMMGAELPGAAGPPAETSVVNTGRTDTISGFDCVWWEVEENGVKLREMCVTPVDNIPNGDEVMTVVGSMSEFYEEVLAQFTANFDFAMSGNPFADVGKMDGFPVKTRSFRDNALEAETVVKSAKAKSIDPSVFEAPAGYDRRSIAGIG